MMLNQIIYIFAFIHVCISFNNNDTIEVITDPKGFRYGDLEYILVEIERNRDGAALWCSQNLNGTLPVPDTEWEYKASIDKKTT